MNFTNEDQGGGRHDGVKNQRTRARAKRNFPSEQHFCGFAACCVISIQLKWSHQLSDIIKEIGKLSVMSTTHNKSYSLVFFGSDSHSVYTRLANLKNLLWSSQKRSRSICKSWVNMMIRRISVESGRKEHEMKWGKNIQYLRLVFVLLLIW